MRVVLASFQDDLNCHGLRCLSSVLRAEGIETELLFLGRTGPHEARFVTGERRPPLSPETEEAILERCARADLVGLSVMTLYYEESARLSGLLRERLGIPVVWGGIHPLCNPEESLQHADLLCLGEAEESLPELVRRLECGQALDGLAGVWFWKRGRIQRNPPRQPPRDLDRFPHPDVSLEGHFALENGRLVPLTRELLLERTGHHYMTIDARGCPLRCTYCCNSQLARRFDWTFVRRRSASRIVDELRQVIARYPEIRGIKLSDDAFGDLPVEYIREFAELYRKDVGLPLGIPGFSPRNLSREKLEPLVEAGLVYLRLGIQSGSPRIRKLYGRRDTNDEIVAAVELAQRYMPPLERLKLDLITDNPWESEEDTLASIRLLLRLEKPYALAVFSLTLFPGTPLHLKARREGLLGDEGALVYRKHFHNLSDRRPLNRILELFTRPWVLKSRIERLLECYREPARFQRELEAYEEELRQLGPPPATTIW